MQSQAKVQCHNAVWHTSSKGTELLEDLLVKYKHIRQKKWLIIKKSQEIKNVLTLNYFLLNVCVFKPNLYFLFVNEK